MKKAFAYLLLVLSILFLAVALINFSSPTPAPAQSGTAELTGFWIGKLLVLGGSCSAVLLLIFWIRKMGKPRGDASGISN